MPAAVLMDQKDASPVVSDEPVAPSETTEGSAPNPRKRKKSSRACDFCHINHQPCDNAKPRCSYCHRHGKPCLYLRPQKKRGPAQGYRSALHSMRESAAAWGAVLSVIPDLGAVIESYLQGDDGKQLVRAIKDPQQQESYIQTWQQSSVFRSFFGDEDSSEAAEAGDVEDPPVVAAGVVGGAGVDRVPSVARLIHPADPTVTTAPPVSHAVAVPPLPTHTLRPPATGLPLVAPYSGLGRAEHTPPPLPPAAPPAPNSTQLPASSAFGRPPLSQPQAIPHLLHANGVAVPNRAPSPLADIVLRDAARSSNNFSETLGPLGFATTETLDDFLAMGYSADAAGSTADNDALLGSELDKKAYYELLMGRQFT